MLGGTKSTHSIFWGGGVLHGKATPPQLAHGHALLEPHDLCPVVGSKSRVSEILSGKRAISKAQIKKLAAFFHVSTDLLI
jgi:hypothetical protein